MLLRLFLAFCTLFVALSCHAQVMVYGFDGHRFTEPVLRLDRGRTFPAFSYNSNDVAFTAIGNQIMEGSSSSEFDLVYTFRENKLYAGNALYSSQIRYTWQDGRIYRGDSIFLLDLLYNVRDGVIYMGANNFPTDALYYIEGEVSITQIFAVLLALGLIA